MNGKWKKFVGTGFIVCGAVLFARILWLGGFHLQTYIHLSGLLGFALLIAGIGIRLLVGKIEPSKEAKVMIGVVLAALLLLILNGVIRSLV